MFSDWNPNKIEINDAVFNYYRTPSASADGKPVLVLQHGFSDNGLCWVPVAQELAADYDILMPDARGHGLSARVARGEKIDQAADLAALMNALGVKKAQVAGHSMGASIMLSLAARFPELVTAMVLEDPVWFIPRPDSPPGPRGLMEDSPMGKWMAELKQKSPEQIQSECRLEHPAWPDAYIIAWCQGKLELDLNFMAADNPWGVWQDQVRRVQCPTLVMTADPALGGIVTPEAMKLAVELNPNVREAHFAGVGHHVRFGTHTAYMQAFKAFLSAAA